MAFFFIQNVDWVKNDIIFMKTLIFGTKKVDIRWFFDDDLVARGREPEKKNGSRKIQPKPQLVVRKYQNKLNMHKSPSFEITKMFYPIMLGVIFLLSQILPSHGSKFLEKYMIILYSWFPCNIEILNANKAVCICTW